WGLWVLMSLSLPAGVTVHGEDGALSYAWPGLSERDFQFTSNRIDFREIDPPIDEPVAVGADAAQVARQGAGRGAFRHVPGRDFRRAARDAINPAWPARLLCLLPALMQEPRQLSAKNQGRSPVIDGL